MPVVTADGAPDEDEPNGVDETGLVPESGAWSAIEVLSDKDFSRYTDDEWAEASRLMVRLGDWGSRRHCRRRVSTRRIGGSVDHRRVVRQAARHDGELVSLPRRRRASPQRGLVFLLDVSRPMDPYRRAYVRFAHAAVTVRRRVGVFSMGTRLTRLTRGLDDRDADRALAAVGPAALDWSGGTRLGEGLHRFNQEWGAPGMTRGAAVVLFSDGWERGEVDLLARGMAAALPYIDRFVEGHSVRSLVDLVDRIDHADSSVRDTTATAGGAG